ncbi:MAG: methyltransferase [Synergistaceae bacterium]|nr:methyltransferase [Synergistaceae bacterium]
MKDGREDLLRGLLKIRQPDEKNGLRVNLDTILLAHFTKPRSRERILEIGCAHGAISLILAKRGFSVEGFDIQPYLVELAAENAEYNGLQHRAKFYVSDLREYKRTWEAQTFDRIVVNPPYDELSKNRSPSDALAAAMHGTMCTLEDVIAASRYLLKNKGYLDMVIRANRVGELFSLLDKYCIPPKVMRSVHPKPGANATVILVEAMCAASHGLKIEPPIFVLGDDGKETRELLEAYRIEAKD